MSTFTTVLMKLPCLQNIPIDKKSVYETSIHKFNQFNPVIFVCLPDSRESCF